MVRRFSILSASRIASGEVPRGSVQDDLARSSPYRAFSTLTAQGSIFTFPLVNTTDVALQLASGGSETLLFANAGLEHVQRGLIKVKQASSGPVGALSYSAISGSVKWPGGSSHSITNSVNAIDIIEYFVDGADVYLTLLGANYS